MGGIDLMDTRTKYVGLTRSVDFHARLFDRLMVLSMKLSAYYAKARKFIFETA